MLIKRDSLGRRIPTFNRSEAQKKVAQERKKNDPDYYSRIGVIGGSRRVGGGFRILKAEDPEKFMEISRKAAAHSVEARKAAKAKASTVRRSTSQARSKKAGKTRRNVTGGNNQK